MLTKQSNFFYRGGTRYVVFKDFGSVLKKLLAVYVAALNEKTDSQEEIPVYWAHMDGLSGALGGEDEEDL